MSRLSYSAANERRAKACGVPQTLEDVDTSLQRLLIGRHKTTDSHCFGCNPENSSHHISRGANAGLRNPAKNGTPNERTTHKEHPTAPIERTTEARLR